MPIVPVVKRDGSICICSAYKITLNRVLKSEVHTLPRIEKLFTTLDLAGGVYFTKLDLSHVYQQLVLEEEYAMLATISTHKGF